MAKPPKTGLPLSRHLCIPNRDLLFLRCAIGYKTEFIPQWHISAHIKSAILALIFTQNLYTSDISVSWCAGRYDPIRTTVSCYTVPHLPRWQSELVLTSWTFPNLPGNHKRSSSETSGPSFHGLTFLYKKRAQRTNFLQLSSFFQTTRSTKKKKSTQTT